MVEMLYDSFEEGKAAQKIDKVYLTTAKLPLDRTNPVTKEVRVTSVCFCLVSDFGSVCIALLFCALAEFIPSGNTSFGSLFVHSLRQSCDTDGAD
jgi:hypothetical protein